MIDEDEFMKLSSVIDDIEINNDERENERDKNNENRINNEIINNRSRSKIIQWPDFVLSADTLIEISRSVDEGEEPWSKKYLTKVSL